MLFVGRTCSFWSDIFSSLSCGSSVQREETPPSLPGSFLSRRPCALMWSTKIEGSRGGITCARQSEPAVQKHGCVLPFRVMIPSSIFSGLRPYTVWIEHPSTVGFHSLFDG